MECAAISITYAVSGPNAYAYSNTGYFATEAFTPTQSRLSKDGPEHKSADTSVARALHHQRVGKPSAKRLRANYTLGPFIPARVLLGASRFTCTPQPARTWSMSFERAPGRYVFPASSVIIAGIDLVTFSSSSSPFSTKKPSRLVERGPFRSKIFVMAPVSRAYPIWLRRQPQTTKIPSAGSKKGRRQRIRCHTQVRSVIIPFCPASCYSAIGDGSKILISLEMF
jgi:hypothetical protein